MATKPCKKCGKVTQVMTYEGEDYCSENCRTALLADDEITAILDQPRGEVNLRGIT